MTLRILGGKWKNHPLSTPPSIVTRPSSSLVKKSLFDRCQSFIEGAAVLDLFAGSGAVGIEALSRGARSVVFVEHHKTALRCLRENIEKLKLQDICRIIPQKVEVFMEKRLSSEAFDLIFIDPPYAHMEQIYPLLDLLTQQGFLKKEGWLFLERGKKISGTVSSQQLHKVEERVLGDSVLEQYRLL